MTSQGPLNIPLASIAHVGWPEPDSAIAEDLRVFENHTPEALSTTCLFDRMLYHTNGTDSVAYLICSDKEFTSTGADLVTSDPSVSNLITSIKERNDPSRIVFVMQDCSFTHSSLPFSVPTSTTTSETPLNTNKKSSLNLNMTKANSTDVIFLNCREATDNRMGQMDCQ